MLELIELLKHQIELKQKIIECYVKIRKIDESEIERLKNENKKLEEVIHVQQKYIGVLEEERIINIMLRT